MVNDDAEAKLRLASGNIATDHAEATVWREDLDPVILGSTFEFQSLPLGDFAVTGSVDWSRIDRAQLIHPATAYVIADIVGNPGNLTLEQLYQLRNQHHWEIRMDNMRDWLDEAGFRRTSMAYPKGAQNHEVRQYVALDQRSGDQRA